ncbi:MAG: GGDEF domain-containing protein [Gammaproteobacteria bacterium]|jgi:diguanylate cyclase (GGDEF)-like protein
MTDSGGMDIKELHWMMDMFQSIDVGVVVVDRRYAVQVWNRFMENHSGVRSTSIIGNNLFDKFPHIPVDWFKRKAESVFLLKSRAFSTWEQRPYIFKFKNYRPITSAAEHMYQNITYIPLLSPSGEVNQIGIIIYDVTDIATNKSELERANSKLQALSRTDRLTQLYNRGYWEDCLIREFARHKRTNEPCSLIMFDIDHFKKVNDTYGHQAGDEVIRITAQAVRDKVRTTDIAGRYGGEEFGIILIDTKSEGALLLAQRLRKHIESILVQHDGRDIRYTVSLGVSEVDTQIRDHKQWLEQADQALYSAKESGRNQAIVYQSKSEPVLNATANSEKKSTG